MPLDRLPLTSPGKPARQLLELEQELRAASDRARAITDSLSMEDLTRRPAPKRWSVAECISHLSDTTGMFLPPLDAALRQLRDQSQLADGPYKMDLAGWLLRWMLKPPVRFRIGGGKNKTATPVDTGPDYKVLPTFLGLQDDLLARLDQATGLAIDRLKVVSPFDARVKYNVYSAFRILAAHQQRHLWQANNVKRALAAAAAKA